MKTEETRAVVHRLYEAYARGDIDAVAAMLDEDIDWIIHGPIEVFPFGGARRGKAAVLQVFAEIAREYQLQRYQPEIMLAVGENAAVLSDVAFVQRATRRTLSFRIADFMRLRNGKVYEFREFTDSFDVTQQALGRWLDV